MMWLFPVLRGDFQLQMVAVQKFLCGRQAIGGKQVAGAAIRAMDADALGRQIHLIGAGAAGAVDLALGLQLLDHKAYDVIDLGIGQEGLLPVRGSTVKVRILLHGGRALGDQLLVKGVQLLGAFLGCGVQHLLVLAEKADVNIGIGAGKAEKILAVK